MKNSFLFCFVMFTSSLFAQELEMKDVNEINLNSKKWSQMFLDGKITEMYDDMKTYWPIPTEKVDEMKNKTLGFSNVINQRFGKAIDIVRISYENLGNVAYREVYFLRHQRSTLRTVFTYYNNGKKWTLSSFEWDDSFSKEFKKDH